MKDCIILKNRTHRSSEITTPLEAKYSHRPKRNRHTVRAKFALCERDLKIYAESFGGALYHYQDYQGREIDAVIELPDGQWCAFEIKLGANQIDTAAQSLLNIQKEFADDPKGKPPAVMCVLCGMANAAYRRPDGVFVVPITALKP